MARGDDKDDLLARPACPLIIRSCPEFGEQTEPKDPRMFWAA